MSSTWCELGAAKVEDGVLFVRCKGGAVDSDGSAPDYGAAPMLCALGVTAMPFPPTEEGAAEGLVDRDTPGFNGIITAARDTRTAKIVGGLKPGDTVVHSTGPQQAAAIYLKEEKRQIAALTKDDDGNALMLVLDGTTKKFQVSVGSILLELDGASGKISLLNGDGGGFLIDGKNFHMMGNPVLGAGNPPGFCLMLGPPSGSPGGPASAPLIPCMGITPGT